MIGEGELWTLALNQTGGMVGASTGDPTGPFGRERHQLALDELATLTSEIRSALPEAISTT